MHIQTARIIIHMALYKLDQEHLFTLADHAELGNQILVGDHLQGSQHTLRKTWASRGIP